MIHAEATSYQPRPGFWRSLIDRFAERVADRVIARVEAQRGAMSQQAAVLVKAAAVDMALAAKALDVAAERLRSAGDSFGAGQTKKAAVRAREAAQGLGK